MGKKKSGKKKKSAKKKGGGDNPNAPENVAKRAELEAAHLRKSIAQRTQMVRQESFKSFELKNDLEDLTEKAESQQNDAHDVVIDLERQYKIMEAKLSSRIQELEDKCAVLQETLETTQTDLERTKTEAKETVTKKDRQIKTLTQRIELMEESYEGVLLEALDSMASKVEQARDKWELESYLVQQKNKDTLLDFGLSHSVTI
eukprot:m.142096 g.142096  ORF g.142096 m.142096 type:complete len:202 (-) comp14874_c0_seq2:2544-3149(-)